MKFFVVLVEDTLQGLFTSEQRAREWAVGKFDNAKMRIERTHVIDESELFREVCPSCPKRDQLENEIENGREEIDMYRNTGRVGMGY